MEKSTRGRQHIMAMYEGTMLTHPDLCVIPKSIRVVRELPVVIGAPLSGGSTSSSGASSSSSGISRSSSGATTQCSSGSDGDDEKLNSADTLCPEMTEEELTGLPRCVLYKYFFTGALHVPFPLIAYILSSTHTRTTIYTHLQYPHIQKQTLSYNTNKLPALYHTATNTFPGECSEYYFNGNLTKYIDNASLTDAQLNAFRTLARKVGLSRTLVHQQTLSHAPIINTPYFHGISFPFHQQTLLHPITPPP